MVHFDFSVKEERSAISQTPCKSVCSWSGGRANPDEEKSEANQGRMKI